MKSYHSQKDGSFPTIFFRGPIFDDGDNNDKLDKNKNKGNKIKDNKRLSYQEVSVTWHYYRATRCQEPGWHQILQDPGHWSKKMGLSHTHVQRTLGRKWPQHMSCVDPTSDMKHEGLRKKKTPDMFNLNPLTEPPLTFHTFPEAFHRKIMRRSTHKNCTTFEAGGKLCVFQTTIGFGHLQKIPKEFKQRFNGFFDRREQNDHSSVGS